MWNKIKQSWVAFVAVLVFGFGLGFGVATPAQTVHSQTTVIDNQTALLRDIYNQVNPSVVSIDVRLQGGTSLQLQRGPQQYTYAAGSGFVYDNQGHIITNAHVVNGADRIEVTFSDDTTMRASVVGVDLDSDIAVLKLEGNTSAYKPLQLADSDQVHVGDRAIAIGNPFQWSGTMTHGIVSGLHRSVEGLAQAGGGQAYQIPNAIQTDAALNPGNSGGPLLNEQGQVIGVNEQIASEVRQSSGVSFAIPSNLVKIVADMLIRDGKVVHSWLGLAGTDLSLDLTEALHLPTDQRGVYVESVQQGSPAAKAGLKGAAVTNTTSTSVATGGDIIVAIDNTPVKHFEDLTSYLFTTTKVGQTVTLTILRDGKQMALQVTLAARPHAQS